MIPVLAVLAVVALVLALTRAPRQPTSDELLAELERALARSGRPIADGVTLAELEHRFRIAPDAAAYVRSLRVARFGGSPASCRLRSSAGRCAGSCGPDSGSAGCCAGCGRCRPAGARPNGPPGGPRTPPIPRS